MTITQYLINKAGKGVWELTKLKETKLSIFPVFPQSENIILK